MTTLPKKKYISPEEYLAMERDSLERHEYLDGEVFQMAGASEKHNTISLNIAGELRQKLKKRPCKAYQTDMRVHIPKTGLFTYPDIMVVCGKPQFLPDTNLDTLTNPILIVEVLSSSTEGYDKGAKFDNYRSLESLREYVLVSQEKALVEQYVKREDGNWIYQATIGFESEVTFSSIQTPLKLSEIYDLVEFEEENL